MRAGGESVPRSIMLVACLAWEHIQESTHKQGVVCREKILGTSAMACPGNGRKEVLDKLIPSVPIQANRISGLLSSIHVVHGVYDTPIRYLCLVNSHGSGRLSAYHKMEHQAWRDPECESPS